MKVQIKTAQLDFCALNIWHLYSIKLVNFAFLFQTDFEEAFETMTNVREYYLEAIK